jgi:ABC-type phosphate transport system auxiliary subunit
MTTEIATVSPFILGPSKKMKKATSILPHPQPVTVAPVVKSKTTEVVKSKTTERSYSQAVLKNVSQSQEALPKDSILPDAKDSLAQIVKIQKIHDNSPLVKMGWEFNFTLKAQQTPLPSIQPLIEKMVGIKATDISVINKKVAVLTIKENQKQEFMKLAEHATLIPILKWSKRELQRHTLLYNRAYYSLLRDSTLRKI